MDIQTVLLLVALFVVALIVVVIYIRRSAAKPIKNAATLYDRWVERLELEPFKQGKKAPEENAKLLAKSLKVLWNKKELEEIDLKPEVPALTQQYALDFITDANELFLEKTTRGFVYDVRDAREANLRIYSLEKDSSEYKGFIAGQAVIKLLRSVVELQEFPDVELDEAVEDDGLSGLRYFVIAQAGMSLSRESFAKITALLSEKFGDEWGATVLGEDVLKFAKLEPEEEPEHEPRDSTPFAQQLEAKRLAEQAALEEKQRVEQERKARWEIAEKAKRDAELAAQAEAIASGKISPLVTQPLAFLSQSIEVAADESGLLIFDEEAYIARVDRIGSPVLFSVYSQEFIDSSTGEFEDFTTSMIASLEHNFGGTWNYEQPEPEATSLTFSKTFV